MDCTNYGSNTTCCKGELKPTTSTDHIPVIMPKRGGWPTLTKCYRANFMSKEQ
jgi:hypothetical protein